MKKIKNIFGKLNEINKRNIVYTTIIFCNIILPYLVWRNENIPFLPYNIDNYRYVISAALQSVAAIFAFIASSTILIFQLSSDNSPKSISFFPQKIFILVMIELVIIITIDGFLLITLSIELNELHLFIVNLIISLNVESTALVIYYVVVVIKWLRPETIFEMLGHSARQANSNEERLAIILSLEELTLKAIQKGYSSTTKKAIKLIVDIVDIYSVEKTNLNVDAKFNTEHPLRVLPSSIARIVKYLSKNDMEDLIHFTAYALAKLCIISKCEGFDYDFPVETSSAMSNIIRECLQKSLESAAYNFIANISYAPEDEDNVENIAYCMKSIIEEALKHENSEYVISQVIRGYSNLAENHVREIEIYCNQAILEVKKYPMMLKQKGWFTEKTINNEILLLESILKTKHNNKQYTIKKA